MTEKLEGGITGKGFKKGDPRINRNGRPKTFDALRTLAQAIAHEAAKSKEGKPITVDGKPISVAESILRDWAISSNADLQKKFIAVAFGEVPQETKLTGDKDKPVRIVIEYADTEIDATAPPFRAEVGSESVE